MPTPPSPIDSIPPDGAIVFSGDTTVNDDLIALARDADILVHQVADLDYLAGHGLTGPDLERMHSLRPM